MEEGTHGWIEGSGEKGEEKKKPFRGDLGDDEVAGKLELRSLQTKQSNLEGND